MGDTATALGQNILDKMGGAVDWGFLCVPKVLKHLRPKRKISKASFEQ